MDNIQPNPHTPPPPPSPHPIPHPHPHPPPPPHQFLCSGASLTVTISFVPSSLSECGSGSPLLLNTSVACPSPVIPAQDCDAFSVRTSDGTWRKATSIALSTDRTQLVLGVASAPTGTTAIATRGMYADWVSGAVRSACCTHTHEYTYTGALLRLNGPLNDSSCLFMCHSRSLWACCITAASSPWSRGAAPSECDCTPEKNGILQSTSRRLHNEGYNKRIRMHARAYI